MSLLRLLTAGKCLMGLKDSGNRYRVNQGALLPKFESAPNPFRKTVLPARAVLEASEPAVAPAALESAAKAQTAGSEAEPRRGLAGRVTTGLKNLMKSSPAKVPKGPAAGKPVQSELGLDNIRVIRNDLSESDIEVVPVRKQALAVPAPASAPAPAAKAPGSWAERGRSLFRRNPAGQEAARS